MAPFVRSSIRFAAVFLSAFAKNESARERVSEADAVINNQKGSRFLGTDHITKFALRHKLQLKLTRSFLGIFIFSNLYWYSVEQKGFSWLVIIKLESSVNCRLAVYEQPEPGSTKFKKGQAFLTNAVEWTPHLNKAEGAFQRERQEIAPLLR